MTNKQKFIQEVSAFNLSPEALAFFETLKAKKVNKKEVEKATVVKEAILDLLKAYDSQAFDRTEIGNELYNAGEFPEEYLLNDKGTIAYNSITAFANQLVAEGQLKKIEVRVGKTKKVKYQF